MGTRKNGRARRRHSLARAHSLFHPLLPSACYAGYGVVIGTKLWESPPSRRVARQLSRGWRGKRETTCSQIIKTTCIFMASCRLFWLVTQSSLRSAWRAPRNVRLRVVSLFFLVLRAKRPRHANYHTRDWRRETGEARQKRVSLFSSRVAALVSQRSRTRALPLLYLKKKRDCSQSIETSAWEATFFTAKNSSVIL